jgi:hypothetical protein
VKLAKRWMHLTITLSESKKLLFEYFTDCPSLVKKINEPEIQTPEDILKYYGV